MTLGFASNKNVNRVAVTALTLLLSAVAAGQTASAQGVDDYAQDALLPPEVVPLDPASAASSTSAQASGRQSDAAAGDVPGLVNNSKGTISARDYRQSAFESLYNSQPQKGQQMGMQQGMPQQGQGQLWESGGVSYQSQSPQNQYMNSPMASMYQQDQMANLAPAQSQTLTGASKNKPKRQDIRRGGFSNNASGLAAFGAGALSATYLMRPRNLLWQMGMFGLAGTGFGTRNGFHF